MNILLFVNGSNDPSTRYRILQFIPYYKAKGIRVKILKYFPEYAKYIKINNSILGLFINTLLNILKVISLLIQLPKFIWADLFIVSRNLIPSRIVLEKLFSHLNKNFIYDFDDAIFLHSPLEIIGSKYAKNSTTIKEHQKTKILIKHAKIVFAGNEFLAMYARKYNKNVHVIPTVIDTDYYFLKNTKNGDKILKRFQIGDKTNKFINIGWMGTSSNLIYLLEILPALEKISKNNSQIRLIICSNDFLYKEEFEKAINTIFVKWNKQIERSILSTFDIGIMPLINNIWTKGKCGFKLIQYMSMGIPSIGSNVGVNNQIINHQINGFLANNLEDWENLITKLIVNNKLREEFSIEGRKTIINKYSIKSIINKIIRLYNTSIIN